MNIYDMTCHCTTPKPVNDLLTCNEKRMGIIEHTFKVGDKANTEDILQLEPVSSSQSV